jgi:hypothetical protein
MRLEPVRALEMVMVLQLLLELVAALVAACALHVASLLLPI